MKIATLAGLLIAGCLYAGSVSAASLPIAACAAPLNAVSDGGHVQHAQFFDDRRIFRGPRFDDRRGRPRIVCRDVSRRIIDQRGRVRIVREEVCSRRG